MTATQSIINQEQEALEQQELKLSLEARVVLAFKHKTPNRYRLLDKLVRAYIDPSCNVSDKRKYLSEKSKKLLVAILKKILNGETPLLNHKYISKATRCKSDQNAKILKELGKILSIQYWDVFTNKNGQNFLRHYTFEINPSITQELKDAGAWNLEFHPDFNRSLYNNKDISNRNNIRSNRANFFNSNFNSQNTSTELVENSSVLAKGVILNSSANTQTLEQAETLHEPQSVETTSPTLATVTPIDTKARPSNKRKTKTREEQKQRKACHIIRSGFLGKGKRLSEIQPYLTDKICEKLRSGSGRSFTNKAIREITKAIAASEKGSQAFFYHINGLVAYLIPALIREKRDPNKVGGENYYTLAGMTSEDKLLQQQEQYLEETERISFKQPCPEHQFRAKLANTLERSTAYNLLLAMQSTSEVKNALVMSLNKAIQLTERQRCVILSQAQAVFNSGVLVEGQIIERVEFVMKANNPNISPLVGLSCERKTAATSQSTVVSDLVQREELQLPQGKWGKVCNSFISDYENGIALYNHWLAPLSVLEKEGIIELSTSSGMVRDRINQNYMPFLVKAAKSFGIKELTLL